MHVFLIWDYDGPVVIDFGGTAAYRSSPATGEEGCQASGLALSPETSRVAESDSRILVRCTRGLAWLAAGIATLVTVRPVSVQDTAVVEACASRFV